VKALSEFNKCVKKSDGHESHCKDCANKMALDYRIEVLGQVRFQTNSQNKLIARSRTEKKCTFCYSVKPLADFGKSATSQDGCKSQCQECLKAYNASRRRKPTNGLANEPASKRIKN
jgi:hypothetical protein